MLLMPDPDTAVIDPFTKHKTLNINCFVRGPGHRRVVHAATRATSRRRPRTTCAAPASPTPRTSGPKPSSTSSTPRVFDQNQYSGYYYLDSIEGVWNSGRDDGARRQPRTSGTRSATRRGTSPSPPDGPVPGPPLRDAAHARAGRHPDRGAAPRGGHRGPGRDRHALRHAGDDGRQADALQVRDQERRARARARRVTFMPKPLFQDNGSGMHVHQSLWKGGEPLFFDEKGYAGLSDLARWYIGGLLDARAVAPRDHEPHHQLVQAARARLRGAGQPRVLAAEPLRRGAHPAVLEEPEGEAARVPLSRPVVQPVPRVLGVAHGRPRRHPEPHRAADAARPRPLRPPARGAGEGAAGAGLARPRCSTRSRPTTSTCSRAACSRPT